MPRPAADPIVVAPTPVPFRPDDSIDHEKLARNVEKWCGTALSGFVVGSAGGEEFYLSEAERVETVRTVAQASRGRKLIIGGIDNPSTTETVRMAELMAKAGAEMVRVRIPQTESGGNTGKVVRYYEEVTRRSPVPVVVIHQTWQTGGFAATPEEIGHVCSMDNVFAYIFWHNVRYESYVRRFVPQKVRFWTPNGSLLLPGVLVGANGACCFFADWGPDMAMTIVQLGMAGRFTEAQELQRRILRADFIGMKFGVSALKAGLNMLGYEATAPRRPTQPLGPVETEELRKALAEAGLLDR
jgi:dihydrodipicolinate synthase/N-acetylneuraminate lyase